MTGFRPANDDHAITEVKFGLTLSRNLSSSDIDAFRQQSDRWSDELPARKEPVGVHLRIDAEVGASPEQFSGAEYAFLLPDGRSSWAFRVLANEITVECTVYSRWDRVWGAALSHLENAFEVLSGTEAPPSIEATQFSVTDVFLCDDENCPPKGCLVESAYVTGHAFNSGSRWHSHSGWFDTGGRTEILHNLNVDSLLVRAKEGKITRLSVVHSMTDRTSHPLTADQLETSKAAFAASVETLHKENKRIIMEVLDPSMIERIGLGESE